MPNNNYIGQELIQVITELVISRIKTDIADWFEDSVRDIISRLEKKPWYKTYRVIALNDELQHKTEAFLKYYQSKQVVLIIDKVTEKEIKKSGNNTEFSVNPANTKAAAGGDEKEDGSKYHKPQQAQMRRYAGDARDTSLYLWNDKIQKHFQAGPVKYVNPYIMAAVYLPGSCINLNRKAAVQYVKKMMDEVLGLVNENLEEKDCETIISNLVIKKLNER